MREIQTGSCMKFAGLENGETLNSLRNKRWTVNNSFFTIEEASRGDNGVWDRWF